MQKQYITNEAWQKMFTFLRKIEEIYIVNEHELKVFLEAVYWMARAGAQ